MVEFFLLSMEYIGRSSRLQLVFLYDFLHIPSEMLTQITNTNRFSFNKQRLGENTYRYNHEVENVLAKMIYVNHINDIIKLYVV